MTLLKETPSKNTTLTYLIHPHMERSATLSLTSRSAENKLEELNNLAKSIDLDIVGTESIKLSKTHPGTFLGKGTVERLHGIISSFKIQLVVINAPLTPVQQRNLEKRWHAKVLDRTGLILEIFGARAHTREGILQVELASLTYQRSRLVRSWTHLERQRGGFGFIGGPGESQLELDKRMLEKRIEHIKKSLEKVKKTRSLHRQSRQQKYPVIALVGYTNAGKSTLFNRLTGANSLAQDKLFATLDPTLRSIQIPPHTTAILSDTVGFISDLPTELVAAFRATLEEVSSADIILHVQDVGHPEYLAQEQDVNHILEALDITVHKNPHIITIYNKIDTLDVEKQIFFVNKAKRSPLYAAISASTGFQCDVLLKKIGCILSRGNKTIKIKISVLEGQLLDWIYKNTHVIARKDIKDIIFLEVSLDEATENRFKKIQRQSSRTSIQ